MFFMYWPTELLEYSTLEVYLSGAVDKMSAPFNASGTRVPNVVNHRTATDGRGIHPSEHVQGLGPLVLTLDLGQQPVGLQVTHRRHRNTVFGQSPGQAPSEVDTGQHVVSVGIKVLDGTAQPPFAALGVGRAGVARCPWNGNGSSWREDSRCPGRWPASPRPRTSSKEPSRGESPTHR